MHVAKCQGVYLGLYAQKHTWPSNKSTMMSTLHEWWLWWPDLPETVLDPPDAMFVEGCIWGWSELETRTAKVVARLRARMNAHA